MVADDCTGDGVHRHRRADRGRANPANERPGDMEGSHRALHHHWRPRAGRGGWCDVVPRASLHRADRARGHARQPRQFGVGDGHPPAVQDQDHQEVSHAKQQYDFANPHSRTPLVMWEKSLSWSVYYAPENKIRYYTGWTRVVSPTRIECQGFWTGALVGKVRDDRYIIDTNVIFL